MKKISIMLGALTLTALLGAPFALAEGRGGHQPPPEVKAAFQACFSQLGVSVTPGHRPELSADQRRQLRSCLEQKGVNPPPHGRHHHGDFRRMKACLEKAGVKLPKPVPGQRPTMDEATRAAFRQCHQELRQEWRNKGAGGDSAPSVSPDDSSVSGATK